MRHLQRGILAVVTALLFVAAPISAQQGELKPAIVFPKVRFDFGDVFERDKYEATFVVQNRGKADLVLADVKPG